MARIATSRTMGVKRTTVFCVGLAVMLGMLLVAKPAHAKTFTVNSVGDTGDLIPGNGRCYTGNIVGRLVPECTLRAAIEETNANDSAPTVDAINFNIPGEGPHTISAAFGMPSITEPVIIDGYTEPGASVNTNAVGDPVNADLRIRLDGSAESGQGLMIFADNSVVRGLSITRVPTALFIVGADNTRIEGNFLGTDPGGTEALGGGSGIVIADSIDGSSDGASNNTIGGTRSPEARNIISANSLGLLIQSSRGRGNKVLGNYIGTTKSGTAELGNSDGGVVIGNGASGNQVGGASRAAANIIAFNGDTPSEDGVSIFGNISTGNRILRNSIFSNAGLGIDLGSDGRTANDPGDVDTGPNNLQNFPVLTSAVTVGDTTTVKGRLNSMPGQTFTIQFFSNPSNDNEGKKFIGETSVTTNAQGNVSFTFSPDRRVALGQRITATATGGDTSEFSEPRSVESGIIGG